MALVKCPECGKENVSDSADACPECGYGIKAYFDKIKQEEERKQQQKRIEEEKKKAEIRAKQQAEQRIKSVPEPTKPIFSHGLIIYLVVATVCISFLFIFVPIMQYRTEDIEVGTTFLEFCVFVFAPLGFYYFSIFSKRVEMYHLAQEDFDKYQRQVIQEQDKAYEQAQASATARAREEALKPECPYCHSHNTTKITATTKVVNAAMFGVLGQKRKYQWHCNGCKSNF